MFRVIEGSANQARAYSFAFILRRHFGVREDGAVALLSINGDGKAMVGIELVAALRCIVPYRHGVTPRFALSRCQPGAR